MCTVHPVPRDVPRESDVHPEASILASTGLSVKQLSFLVRWLSGCRRCVTVLKLLYRLAWRASVEPRFRRSGRCSRMLRNFGWCTSNTTGMEHTNES
jgi:hypothetical protein